MCHLKTSPGPMLGRWGKLWPREERPSPLLLQPHDLPKGWATPYSDLCSSAEKPHKILL